MNEYTKANVEKISQDVHKLSFADGRELHLEGDVEIAAQAEIETLLDHGGKPFQSCGNGVVAEWHQGREEAAACLADHRLGEAGVVVGHDDGDPG